MQALHFMKGPWMIMAHGNVFVGYDHQGSDRGDSQWMAPNWVMLMETRPAGRGRVMLREMLSLEPWTVPEKGYPLLFQTGESFRGAPNHDRQHPHDLFMEIAASYTRPLSRSAGLELYAAPAGEPALGPVAFPHRFSSASNPLSPLGHHWQDSTHITFGVLTAGVFTHDVKLEASWFNGREPDERRYDFDFRELDSWSGRVSWNPGANWSLQASWGFLASPEELHPEESVHRFTASASYCRPTDRDGALAVTGVWGRNQSSAEPATNSWLVEADYVHDARSTFFGRAEHVRKSGADLALPSPLALFDVPNLVAGYVARVATAGRLEFGLGGLVSMSAIDSRLEQVYGASRPVGFMIFLAVHPSRMGPSMGIR